MLMTLFIVFSAPSPISDSISLQTSITATTKPLRTWITRWGSENSWVTDSRQVYPTFCLSVTLFAIVFVARFDAYLLFLSLEHYTDAVVGPFAINIMSCEVWRPNCPQLEICKCRSQCIICRIVYESFRWLVTQLSVPNSCNEWFYKWRSHETYQSKPKEHTHYTRTLIRFSPHDNLLLCCQKKRKVIDLSEATCVTLLTWLPFCRVDGNRIWPW